MARKLIIIGLLLVLTGIAQNCSGKLNMSLDPNTVMVGQTVYAYMNNLSNCENKTIHVYNVPCGTGGIPVCFCSDGTECSCSFQAPTVSGSYVYYACIDQDDDLLFSENESANASLTVRDRTVLEPDCNVTPDSSGFVELKALAGYYAPNNKTLYCYGTKVTAAVGGKTYEMNKFYNCQYSKLIQLAPSTYIVTYTANYSGFPEKTASCLLDITSSAKLSLVVYLPKNNTYFKTNQLAHIEAAGLLGGKNIAGGTANAKLMKGTTVVSEVNLTREAYIFKGDLLLGSQEGKYFIRISLNYDSWTAYEDLNVTVNDSYVGENLTQPLYFTIDSPQQGASYNVNTSLDIMAELRDQNNFPVTGAEVSADLFLDWEKIEEIKLEGTKWYYKKRYDFLEPGEYFLNFTGTYENNSVHASVLFYIGSIAEALNFSVRIITPSSDVYAENSSIIVRAKVLKEKEPVKDASVSLFFQDSEIEMDYDRYGEYVTTIGPLEEGAYEIRVLAVKEDLAAQDKVLFMVSRHRMVLELLSPKNETTQLKKGDSISINANVFDEEGDIAMDVLVVAKIQNPEGTPLEAQLFQDDATGEYRALFYVSDLEGVYIFNVTASKPDYLAQSKSAQVNVKIKKEKIVPFTLDIETLLTILLGLAILILLISLLKIIF